MKKWFKAVNLFLIICIVASTLPTSVQATEIVASSYCGVEEDESNLTWTLDSNGTLRQHRTKKAVRRAKRRFRNGKVAARGRRDCTYRRWVYTRGEAG